RRSREEVYTRRNIESDGGCTTSRNLRSLSVDLNGLTSNECADDASHCQSIRRLELSAPCEVVVDVRRLCKTAEQVSTIKNSLDVTATIHIDDAERQTIRTSRETTS